MNDAQGIVDRLKTSTNSSTNTNLAKILKVGGSTIRTWVVRDSVPIDKCMEISNQYNKSIEWILTGNDEQGSTNQSNNKIDREEFKNALMEGLFTATQLRAIKIEDGGKIGDIADILMTELQEKHPVLFNEKQSKAS